MANMVSFWEKMHCAAGEHATLALDYGVPNKMRSSLDEWRTEPQGNTRRTRPASACSFFRRERRPSIGYSGSQAEAFAPLPTSQLQDLRTTKPQTVQDLRTTRPQVARVSQPQQKQQQEISPMPPMREAQRSSVKTNEGTIAPRKDQNIGAPSRRQQDASLQEARMLLQKLMVQPAADEVNALPTAAVAAPSANAERQAGAGIRASPEGTAARIERLRSYDGLESAMNRRQSAHEVRQLLSNGPAIGKGGRKDSFSAASTQIGSTATSVGGTPPVSRKPSKEMACCDPNALARSRRAAAGA